MKHIEAMKLALDHSEPSILSPGWTLVRNEDIAALREALAEQPAQQEPDAIVTSLTADPDGVARSGLDRELPLMAGVYLAPQPAQRNQLTTQEIREWWLSENGLEDCVMCKFDDFEKVVRAVESEYGIKENT